MTGPQGNKINCFPRDQSFPEGTVIKWLVIWLEILKLEIHLTSLQRRSLVNIRGQQCNVTLWRQRFCNVFRSEILAGNSFIVRCHVTSKKPMRARAVGKKFPAINNWIYSSEPPDSLTEKKTSFSSIHQAQNSPAHFYQHQQSAH